MLKVAFPNAQHLQKLRAEASLWFKGEIKKEISPKNKIEKHGLKICSVIMYKYVCRLKE